MDPISVGKRIAALRKDLNMTQKQLAEILGVTNKAISKWETGDGYPDITIIPQLADALGTTTDYLLSDVVPEKVCTEPVTRSVWTRRLIFTGAITLGIMVLHVVCWYVYYLIYNSGHISETAGMIISYAGVVIWSAGPVIACLSAIAACITAAIDKNGKSVIIAVIIIAAALIARGTVPLFFVQLSVAF